MVGGVLCPRVLLEVRRVGMQAMTSYHTGSLRRHVGKLGRSTWRVWGSADASTR